MERRGTTAAVRQTRCFEAVLFAGAMVGCMYVMGMLRGDIEVTDMHGPWERDYAWHWLICMPDWRWR